MMTRRSLLWGAASVCLRPSPAFERSFWVMKLLYPGRLMVRPVGTARLHCQSAEGMSVMEGDRVLRLSKNSEPHRVSGPGGAPVDFVLEVPGALRRRYRGVLDVSGTGEILRPLVTMDGETALGSIVGAELLTSSSGLAVLAAQAIVSRSFLLSREGRHRHGVVDCCDTTHCQFLRSPAARGGAIERAVCETSGLLLQQGGRTAFARYSGACGGRTQGGSCDEFRYSSVACEPCRIAGRTRQGHGWGLCQQGAMKLAQSGWDWPAILSKYYPDFVVKTDSATV